MKDILRKASTLGLSGYLGLIICVFASSPVGADQYPPDPHRELIQISSHAFWMKPKYYQRIEDDRAIMVSVRSSAIKHTEKQNLSMEGAGMVDRRVDQCYNILKQFSRWKEMSDYIQSSEYDPKTKILKLHLLAFKYHAHLKLRIFHDGAEDKVKALRFLVLDGEFKDMKGVLQFKDHERRRTEISMTVYDEFDKLPLPKFFIEFGLEVVFQKMAERMRSFIENEYPRPQ